ncbi:helix-turn-helix transcriptional regulator [Duganella sp. FT80W]|uniref:Helix-turn-helix transcriptional regulator n=1 Tax=Duganella guangzhouensis TaxID=2666084 RepID=A0A6I2L931_9BURK|nr:helix-turn-helix transcriptional regulator [Duganella guangzhouensis]MRW93344.1 helix-turn-helix transcriptional regulator [Duganella guangzhouensis]
MNAIMFPAYGPDFSQFVAKIYDSALDPGQWGVFLTELAQRLNSHGSIIWANDFAHKQADIALPGDGFFVNHGFDPAALETFSAYYSEHNIWLQDETLHNEGQVVVSSHLFPDNRVKKTEYWGDWLRPQEIFYSTAAVVEKRNSRSVNVTLVRAERAGPYTQAELAMMRELMPHFQSAIALHRRLHQLKVLSESATEALERMFCGVILLDAQGQVLHATRRALAMIDSSLLLTCIPNRRLSCLRSADNAQLQKILQRACGIGAGKMPQVDAGGSMRILRSDRSYLQILVTPLPSWSSPFGVNGTAAVFLTDSAAEPRSLSATLCKLYQLTEAEARLTEALVNGCTLQEYADKRQLSLNTIRTQVRAAAAKIGVTRQSDLVRIVLTGPAVLGKFKE